METTNSFNYLNADDCIFSLRYFREFHSKPRHYNVIERVLGLVSVYFDMLDGDNISYFRIVFIENNNVYYQYTISYPNWHFPFNCVLSDLFHRCTSMNISLLSDFQKDLKNL